MEDEDQLQGLAKRLINIYNACKWSKTKFRIRKKRRTFHNKNNNTQSESFTEIESVSSARTVLVYDRNIRRRPETTGQNEDEDPTTLRNYLERLDQNILFAENVNKPFGNDQAVNVCTYKGCCCEHERPLPGNAYRRKSSRIMLGVPTSIKLDSTISRRNVAKACCCTPSQIMDSPVRKKSNLKSTRQSFISKRDFFCQCDPFESYLLAPCPDDMFCPYYPPPAAVPRMLNANQEEICDCPPPCPPPWAPKKKFGCEPCSNYNTCCQYFPPKPCNNMLCHVSPSFHTASGCCQCSPRCSLECCQCPPSDFCQYDCPQAVNFGCQCGCQSPSLQPLRQQTPCCRRRSYCCDLEECFPHETVYDRSSGKTYHFPSGTRRSIPPQEAGYDKGEANSYYHNPSLRRSNQPQETIYDRSAGHAYHYPSTRRDAMVIPAIYYNEGEDAAPSPSPQPSYAVSEEVRAEILNDNTSNRSMNTSSAYMNGPNGGISRLPSAFIAKYRPCYCKNNLVDATIVTTDSLMRRASTSSSKKNAGKKCKGKCCGCRSGEPATDQLFPFGLAPPPRFLEQSSLLRNASLPYMCCQQNPKAGGGDDKIPGITIDTEKEILSTLRKIETAMRDEADMHSTNVRCIVDQVCRQGGDIKELKVLVAGVVEDMKTPTCKQVKRKIRKLEKRKDKEERKKRKRELQEREQKRELAEFEDAFSEQCCKCGQKKRRPMGCCGKCCAKRCWGCCGKCLGGCCPKCCDRICRPCERCCPICCMLAKCCDACFNCKCLPCRRKKKCSCAL